MTIKDIVEAVDWKHTFLAMFCIITILSACICVRFCSLSEEMKSEKLEKVSLLLFVIVIVKTICIGRVAFYWKDAMSGEMELWQTLLMLILMIVSLLEWFLLVILGESKKQRHFIMIEFFLIVISIIVLGLTVLNI